MFWLYYMKYVQHSYLYRSTKRKTIPANLFLVLTYLKPIHTNGKQSLKIFFDVYNFSLIFFVFFLYSFFAFAPAFYRCEWVLSVLDAPKYLLKNLIETYVD